MKGPTSSDNPTIAETYAPVQAVLAGEDPAPAIDALRNHPWGEMRIFQALCMWVWAAVEGTGDAEAGWTIRDSSGRLLDIEQLDPVTRTTARIIVAGRRDDAELAYDLWVAVPIDLRPKVFARLLLFTADACRVAVAQGEADA